MLSKEYKSSEVIKVAVFFSAATAMEGDDESFANKTLLEEGEDMDFEASGVLVATRLSMIED